MAEAEARRPVYVAAKEDDESDEAQDSDEGGDEDTEDGAEASHGEDDEGAEALAKQPQNEAERLRRAHDAALRLSKDAAELAARAQADLERAPKEIERRMLRSGGTLQDPAAVNARRIAETLAQRTLLARARRDAEAALLAAEAENEASAPQRIPEGAPVGPWVNLSGPALSRGVRASTRAHTTTFSEEVMRARTRFNLVLPARPSPIADAADDSCDAAETGATKRPLPGKCANGPKRANGPAPARTANGPAPAVLPGKDGGRGGRGGGRGGRRLRPGKGRMAAPSKRSFTVLRLLERRTARLGGVEYLVEWAGYPPESASWEPTSHISPFVVEAFENSTTDPLVSASIAARSSVPEREVSAAERDLLLDSSCPLPKQWQSNTPSVRVGA